MDGKASGPGVGEVKGKTRGKENLRHRTEERGKRTQLCSFLIEVLVICYQMLPSRRNDRP